MTEAELRADICARIEVEYGGNQRDASRAWGVSEPMVSYVVHGDAPGPKLLSGAGYKVVYRRA